MLGKMSLKNYLQIFIFTFLSIYQSERSIVYLLFFSFNLKFVILLLLIKTLKMLIYSICFVSSTFWPFGLFLSLWQNTCKRPQPNMSNGHSLWGWIQFFWEKATKRPQNAVFLFHIIALGQGLSIFSWEWKMICK